MSSNGLDQQFTLEPQPDDPADARMPAGDVLVPQSMRVHQVPGHLKVQLERGHQSAHVALPRGYRKPFDVERRGVTVVTASSEARHAQGSM